MTLIEKWKIEAEERGLNLSDLARLADVDRSMFTRWKVKVPQAVEVYLKIEQALNETAKI